MNDLDDLTGLLERLTDAASFQEAADHLVSWAREVTGCRTALLRLTHADGEEATWVPACAHQGADERFARDELVVSATECVCGRVATGDADPSLPFFTEHGSFVWGSVRSMTRQFPARTLGPLRGRCISEGYESVAVFPLMGPSGPVGCLHVADPEPGRFQGAELTVEAACRLAGRILLHHRSAEREHALLEAVQTALLPGEPPQVANLEVGVCFASATDAALIGGDFYDILDLGDGRALVVVGDYSGRGLEAAGLAARARYTIATLAHEAEAPGALLAAANRLLVEGLPRGRFVTAVVCLLDTVSGTVHVALAGHPGPMILDTSTAHEVDAPPNLPLGVMPDTSFGESTFPLPPHATLLLYTDGVSEARQGDRQFGVEGIASTWRAARASTLEGLACAVCEASGAYGDPGHPPDDRLVLAVRARPGEGTHPAAVSAA
ncbi:MAG: hypothetical protein Kow00122_06460 [Thermoleophilia bacterium]